MKEYVLMADVISSGSHFPTELMADLRSLVNETNVRFASSISSPLTITLGDEFQGIVKNEASGVEIILSMEELILENEYQFKLRYILSEGEVDTEINSKNAYEMLGRGLTEAREQLIELKKESHRFQFKLHNDKRSDKMNKLFKLLQHFLDSWNPKDQSTVAGFLKGLDYKELAKLQNKDDSSLWRRRRSLAIDEYKTCKELIMEATNG